MLCVYWAVRRLVFCGAQNLNIKIVFNSELHSDSAIPFVKDRTRYFFLENYHFRFCVRACFSYKIVKLKSTDDKCDVFQSF